MTNDVGNTYAIQNVAGKRRFALSITVFTVLGHAFLGFEASYAQPLVALATAYVTQLLLEFVDARGYWSTATVCRRVGAARRLPVVGPHRRPVDRHVAVLQ